MISALAATGVEDPDERAARRAAARPLGGPLPNPAQAGVRRPPRRGLDEGTRTAVLRALGDPFDDVSLRADQRAGAIAAAAEASAVTAGTTVYFAPGRYRPDRPAGRALLLHELAHARQVPRPGARVRREGRTRQYRVDVAEPDLFQFPGSASREDIAETLFGDARLTANFVFARSSSTELVEGVVPRAVRGRPMSALPEGPISLVRWASDRALDRDVEATISLLKQAWIRDADEWALAELCLRWSQYSDVPAATGGHYFDRYLARLRARSLTEPSWLPFGSPTTRTAFEWLLIETAGKAEQVKKAIESRSSAFAGSTGYVITDAAPTLRPGDVVGRFYWSTGSGIQVLIRAWVGNVPLEDAAVPLVRREFFSGSRPPSGMEIGVVVPRGGDGGGGFDAYVAGFPSMDLLVEFPIGDKGGHFYWYPPGTRLVSTHDMWEQAHRNLFQADIAGQEADREADLVRMESVATSIRLRHGGDLLPAGMVDAWLAADRVMVTLGDQLGAAAADSRPPVGVNTVAVRKFFDQARDAVRAFDRHHGTDPAMSTPPRTSNVYFEPSLHWAVTRRLEAATTFDQWRRVLGDYNRVTRGMDEYFAQRLRDTGKATEANELEFAGRISRSVAEQVVDHPGGKRLRAVFYPLDLLTAEAGGLAEPVAQGLSLYFYLYRRGETWYLLDLTTARTKDPVEEQGGTETTPPPELFRKLNTRLRFPRGRLYWELPGGGTWTMETTEPVSTGDWLQALGLSLGLLGMTVATGGVATTLFIASGLVSATAAAYDIHEKSEAGVLTETDVILNVAGIVGSLASAGATATGRIIATSAGRTGTAARIATTLDGRIYLPLIGTSLVAGGVTMVVGIDAAIKEYRDATRSGAGEASDLALRRLVAQLLLTGGLGLLAVKGDVADFRRGRNLYLDPDFGPDVTARTVLSERELLRDLRATPGVSNAGELSSVLARADVDADLALRLRADVTQALRDGLIDAQSLQRRLSGMRRAADVAQVRQELAELRHANRVVSSGAVAEGSKVYVGVKQGNGPFDLGGGSPPVDIRPVPEADLLFRGADGRVHLHEVKHRVSALQDKGPQQIRRMKQWYAADPDKRGIRVSVDSDQGWTNGFSPPSPIRALIDQDVSLHIAGATWSPAKMEEIWVAVERKARSTGQYPPRQDFFDNMPTLDAAEDFLGISMR